MTILLLVLALLVIGYLAKIAISQKTLYSDKGLGSRIFQDTALRIRAKPDRIEGTKSNAMLAEYKDRVGTVYQSDVVQVYASVLAARSSGINITSAVIFTKNGGKKNVKLGDTDFILSHISRPLKDARNVAAGGEGRA